MTDDNNKHEYEGGTIVPLGDYEVGDHYHIDYLLGPDAEMGWGYVVDVEAADETDGELEQPLEQPKEEEANG